jgi:hypothetical protein
MAITPLHSSQYLAAKVTEPRSAVHGSDWGGKLRMSYGKITFTAAGTGTAKMVTLPAGRKIILTDLCRFICPAGTSTADAHNGFTAYTQPDGTAVSADDNAFLDNSDIGGGAIDSAFVLPADGVFVLDSVQAVDIELMIDTANSPASGDAYVVVVYAEDN